MQVLEELAEARITEALERGDLDDLPGAGGPITLEVDPFVPEEQRMAFKILKNAGYLPAELELRNEIEDAAQTAAETADGEDYRATLKRLQCLMLRLEEGRGRSVNLALQEEYYRKVLTRLARS